MDTFLPTNIGKNTSKSDKHGCAISANVPFYTLWHVTMVAENKLA